MAALRTGSACALFMAVVAACATGGKDNNDGQPIDAPRPLDAPAIPIDAPRVVDAFVTPMVDAPPPMVDAAPVVVDAPPGGGLFCTANNQCTVGGECCVTLGGPQGFCAPGQVILGQCVPN